MLTYLFIAFVIMVALAPLTHFMPSKRQRAVASMREYAAVHGLFVELRRPPTGPGVPAPPDGEVIYYGKRLPLSLKQEPTPCQWVREEGQWRAVDRRTAVPEAVQSLPGEAFAASLDGGSCGAYWVESGGDERRPTGVYS